MASPGTIGLKFTNEDLAALEKILRLLRIQATAKNAPALEFARKLDILDNNLQSLLGQLQPVFSADVFELLSNTTSH